MEARATDVSPWTCPTCRSVRDTPYCPVCGEQPAKVGHLTLVDFVRQLAESFTSVDGKLIRSLRWLVSVEGCCPFSGLSGNALHFATPSQNLFFGCEGKRSSLPLS